MIEESANKEGRTADAHSVELINKYSQIKSQNALRYLFLFSYFGATLAVTFFNKSKFT